LNGGRKQGREVWRCLLLGGCCGFVSGFFGAGGGVVLLLGGRYLVTEWREMEGRELFASTLAVTAVLSLVSLGVYGLRGELPLLLALRLLPSAVLGGVLGALLLDRLPIGVIRAAFGVLTAVGGLLMLLR